MARQRMRVGRAHYFRRRFGLPVVNVLVRGGTDHRIDLWLQDGSIASWYRGEPAPIMTDARWVPEDEYRRILLSRRLAEFKRRRQT